MHGGRELTFCEDDGLTSSKRHGNDMPSHY